MIVAIIVLLVVSLITTVIISTADQTNLSTRHDANYKNAAEAAEAGLQVAAYRLNMLVPSNTQCVADAVGSPGTNGLCQSSVVSMGNGATFQYSMSPVLSSGSTCIGLTITNSDVNNRCITAVGVSNGVQARSQVRAAAFTAAPLFPVSGVIGLKSVTLSGSAKVAGVSGTNGPYNSSGSATSSGGLQLGPAATDTDHSSSLSTPVTHLASPLVLSPVESRNVQPDLSECLPGARGSRVHIVQRRLPDHQRPGESSRLALRPVIVLRSHLHRLDPCRSTSVAEALLADPRRGALQLLLSHCSGAGGFADDRPVRCPGRDLHRLARRPRLRLLSQQRQPDALGREHVVQPQQQPTRGPVLRLRAATTAAVSITISGNSAMYGVLYAPQSQVTLSGSGALNGSIAAY